MATGSSSLDSVSANLAAVDSITEGTSSSEPDTENGAVRTIINSEIASSISIS